MIKELIVADDFTGGLDTGVMFAKNGFATWMSDDRSRLCGYSGDYVAVLDTETRHLKKESALEKLRKTAEFAREKKIPLLFKKTDSLLRGNLGAELEGMILGSGRNLLVFAPAYPEMGRTVEEGRLFIEGKPLTAGSYADDLISSVQKNRVKDIVRAQTAIPIRETRLLDRPPVVGEKAEIYICDTTEEEDFRMIAEAIKPVADQVILAGCGGFAKYISEYLAGTYIERKKQEPYRSVEYRGQTVFCGSVNGRTRKQIKYAVEKGVFLYKLRPEEYLAEKSPERTARRLLALQRRERQLLICTVSEQEDICRTVAYAKSRGIAEEELYGSIASGLGQIAAACMKDNERRGFSVVGGDTLYHTMEAAGYKVIRPVVPLREGAVLSKVYWKEGGARYLVSKAGSFGGNTAIWELFQKEN